LNLMMSVEIGNLARATTKTTRATPAALAGREIGSAVGPLKVPALALATALAARWPPLLRLRPLWAPALRCRGWAW